MYVQFYNFKCMKSSNNICVKKKKRNSVFRAVIKTMYILQAERKISYYAKVTVLLNILILMFYKVIERSTRKNI